MVSFKSLEDIYRNLSKDDLITILERSNDAIFIMDSEKYLYLNQAAADILKYDTPEELIGTDSFKHVAPEYREISKNYLKKRSNGNFAPNKYSMQLLTKTGRRVDIETNVSVIDFRGVHASLAITRDISEHKKIRNDLEIALTLNEAQNQMLVQFLNSVKDEVTIFDSEMRFLYVNDALVARTGIPKEMYLGKHITDYVPDIQSTERYDKYQEVIKTGIPVKFDRVQPIGDDVWLDIFAFKVTDGIGIITSNITDNVRFESTLLELNEYMSRINQCRSLENVFNLTLDAMANALKHYSHDIFMHEDYHMVQVANRNLPSGAHIPLTATSVVVKSFIENKTVVVNDVSAEPNYFFIKNPSTGNAFDEYEMSRSELVVPIRIEGNAVGVLNVESTEINAFIEQDVTLLEILASTVATAISRLQRTNMLMTQAVELEAKRVQLSAFINSATEGFMMIDEDMRYIEANNSWLQYAGLERKDVIGKHVLEVVPKLKETGRYDAYMKVLETGEPVEFNAVESVSRRGLIVDVSAFKAGDILGIITRDVSDRVRFQGRLEALHVYGSKLSNAVSIEEVAKFTLDAVDSVFGYQYSDFNIVQDDYLVPILLSDNNLQKNLNLHIGGPGIIVRAYKSGRSQLVNDTRLDEDYVYGRGEDTEWLSELAVPVKIEDNVVAVINLEHHEMGAFSENDQKLVETLASHVASAFSKIKYNERLTDLHSFALELGTTESLEDIVETTFRIMREVLGFQFSSFQLLEEEGLVSVGTTDNENLGTVFPLSGKGITTRAAREARTMLVGDVRDDLDFICWLIDSRSELAVPILGDARVLGVLNVESLQLDAFSDDDARLLEILAQNVGASMYRIRVVEEKTELERQVFVQRVQVEQEQELSQLKTRFMSTATHEIRTPLSSILGYTELIQMDEGNLSEAQRQYFTVIQRNVNRLTVLTDDLLDLQRLEEGMMSVNLEQVNIRDLVDGVESEFAPILVEKDQSLEVSCVDVVVNMDRLRVMQVLVNLLSNASKFSPVGSVIGLDVVESGDGVQVTVSDNGVGLLEEEIGKLFTPFPGILVNGNVSGTGLGLSICKGIVELHGGKIWAESGGLGKGSRFSFTIPYSK